MKTYNVVIHFAGAINIEVDAASEEKAKELAELVFDEISDADLIANIAEVDVCDCIEIK